MPNTGGILEFGPFKLEPAERRLTLNGRPIALTPKAFDLLVILAENAGRLLKKEELLERLWPGVFVEEVNLAQNISALRKALGGDGREAFIQTVAGTGYRFVPDVSSIASTQSAPHCHRLIVLPFRMLKPDQELDFLAFSLPDAITAELSAIDSLIVRSSLMAARFAAESPDLARIAREAQVDFIVSGTVLRAGDQIRVSAQLADATSGTLVWSHTVQSPVGDLFRLQDTLSARIGGSLLHPLAPPEQQPLSRDVPSSAKAYELFLRGNQASPSAAIPMDRAIAARDLYEQSLAEDPEYAPAWARLARMYRMLGKYVSEDSVANLAKAGDALRRALALNPDLPIAHNLFWQIEVDRGRAADAMTHLLRRLHHRGPNAELYAGLVQACRFAGLLDASEAAFRRAQRLDPALPTSAMHTYFVMRRYEEVIAVSGEVKGYVYSLSLDALGRGPEALENIALLEKKAAPMADFVVAVKELVSGRFSESADALMKAQSAFGDPEAFYYAARHFARIGYVEASVDALKTSLQGGYVCARQLVEDPWLEPVRSHAAFGAMLELARSRHDEAVAAFRDAEGPRLLGVAAV